jgi:hypothetical protein
MLGPFDPGVPSWRFNAAALLSGRITAVALAYLVTAAAAIGAGHATWLRIQGILGILVAVLLLLGLASLWLDGPSVQATVPANQLKSFTAQWVRGLLVGAVGAVIFAVLGIRLLRSNS